MESQRGRGEEGEGTADRRRGQRGGQRPDRAGLESHGEGFVLSLVLESCWGVSDMIHLLKSPLTAVWRMDRRGSSGSKETSEVLTAQNKQYTKTGCPKFLQEQGDTAGDPTAAFHESVVVLEKLSVPI